MRYRGVLLSLLFPFIVYAQSDSLILSEIMFYPFSGNNEFIELYNAGTADINLLNYKIKYYTSSPDTITGFNSNTIIHPSQYAVVFEGDYDFTNGIYKDLVPDSAVILKINNNSFGSGGMANTSARPIFLLSPEGDSLDSYFYSANNNTGYSDEKTLLTIDTSSSLWQNSQNLNGTPGYRNSVMPFLYNLKIKDFDYEPLHPSVGDEIVLYSEIFNNGTSSAESFIVNIYCDINGDSIPSPAELISSENLQNLQAGDSTIAVTTYLCINAGTFNFIAEVKYPSDENTSDNSRVINITVSQGVQYNSVVINEIMYAPKNSEPEWIELYNNSGTTVNLKNWMICDAGSCISISRMSVYLEPGKYIIISRDSSLAGFYPFQFRLIQSYLPSFNNTGDAVVLTDSIGRTVDSLFYFPSWGGTDDFSLEKINSSNSSTDPLNWGTSENFYKATPGFKNSISPKDHDAAVSSFKIIEKYAITGEMVSLKTCFKNKGTSIESLIPVSIFRDLNQDSIVTPDELITSFVIPEILPSDSLSYIIKDSLFRSGYNFYITQIDFPDEDTCNNKIYFKMRGVEAAVFRHDIVINEIMHSPADEPEWIELFNRTNEPINLKNFRIAEASDTTYLTKQNIYIPASGFLIISPDSVLLNKRNIFSGFIKTSFAPLNNNGDKVILIDSLDRTIDSLFYAPDWGGNNGYSLERINSLPSYEKINWSTSISRYKGTAGYINSISPKKYDAEITAILADPENPVKEDTLNIKLKIKNRGTHPSLINYKLLTDTNHDSIPDFITESSSLFIRGNDSAAIPLNYKLISTNNFEILFAQLLLQGDQDTSNNYISKKINFGYHPNSIAINEVMFNPGSSESEWIELYNRSNEYIDLKNWKVSDILTTPVSKLISNNYLFAPHTYLIISPDSSIINCHRIIPSDILISSLPNLNNDADGIILYDDREIVIDSMSYNAANPCRNSLERIDINSSSAISSNWNYSNDIESGTPGRINSITPKKYDLTAGQIYITPRFPVIGDSVSISASVYNHGLNSASGYRCSFIIKDTVFYSMDGPLLNSGDSCIIICPGKIPDLNNQLKVTFTVEFIMDNDPLNNLSGIIISPGEAYAALIINEIMYNPSEGCSEWIEIFNSSSEIVNIRNWFITDLLPNPTGSVVSNNDYYVFPGEYLILSQDSSVLNIYPEIKKLITVPFGALSSSGDGIILYDYRKGIIDSVRYKPSLGGRIASLERVSPDKNSADSTNWLSSLSPEKGTPGDKNSVSGLPPYERSSVIINEIMYDPAPGNCEFIELYNRSDSDINIGGWRFEDAGSESLVLSDTNFFIPSGGYFIFATDSSMLENYPDEQINHFRTSENSSLSLSNSGEILMIRDISGTVIDSLRFYNKFHNKNFIDTKNRSIERISPDLNSVLLSNWSSSTDFSGATPGKQNSIFSAIPGNNTGITISPNPFSPDNDGWEDFCIINYSFGVSAPQLRMKIFDNAGRLMRILVDDQPSGSSGSLIFDGRDDSGRSLRLGIYILYVEAAGIQGSEKVKIPFVIARKL